MPRVNAVRSRPRKRRWSNRLMRFTLKVLIARFALRRILYGRPHRYDGSGGWR